MGGFGHEPHEGEPEDFQASMRNMRVGMGLFLLYLAFYGGFVLINAFRPRWMDAVVGGVNVAIWYGFGLIVAAFVLALIYVWVCRAVKPSS